MDEVGFVLRFGFLVGRFRSSEYWFEAAIMGRKLLVVVCMTFFFTEEAKANAAVFALLGCCGQLVWARPYVAPFHNGLAILVLGATTCVLYSGTFVDRTFRRVGVMGGVVVNVLAIVVGNAVDVWRIARSEKEVEEEEFFQEGVFQMDSDPKTNGSIVASGSFGSEVGLHTQAGTMHSVDGTMHSVDGHTVDEDGGIALDVIA